MNVLLRLLFYPLFLFLLFQLLVSSFFLSRFWLPLIASLTGCDLTVENAELSFLKRPNLVLSGVQLSDRETFLLNFDRIQGELSIAKLFTGVISCDSIEVDHAEFRLRNRISKTQTSSGGDSESAGKELSADDIKLGIIEIKHLNIIHENESGSKELARLHLKNVNLTGLTPDIPQILKLDASLSAEYPELRIEKTEAHLEAKFTLNRTFLPKDLLLSAELRSGNAESQTSAFADLSGSFTVQAKQDLRIPSKYHVSGGIELNQFDCVEYLEMKLKRGEIFLSDLHGDFTLDTDCHISDYRLEKFYLPKRAFYTGTNYFPEKLSFHSQTQVSFSPSGFSVRGQADASAEKFWYDNAILMDHPQFQMRHNWSYNCAKQSLTVRQIEATFNGTDFQSELHNSGTFTYDFRAGEISAGNASIRGNARNLPLLLFNPAIPIDFGGGLCDMELLLEKHGKPEFASGSLDLRIREFSVNAANSPLIKPQELSVKAALNSKGSSNLRELKVERCHIELGDEKEIAAQSDLKGTFRFIDQELSLDGTLLLRAFPCLERITSPVAQEICQKLRDAHSEKMIYLFHIMTLFQPQKNHFTFQTESKAQAVSLLGEPEYQNRNLTLSLNGDFTYSVLGSNPHSKISMQANFFAEDLLDLAADAVFHFPEQRSDLKLNLKQLNPAILRSMMRWQEPETRCQKNLTEKFSFDALSANAEMHSDFRKNTFRIQPMTLKVNAMGRGVIRLSLDTPILGSFSTDQPQLANTKMTLSLEDLPIVYFNHFIPDYSEFFFADGLVQGNSTVILKDSFRTLDMMDEILIENLKFKLCDSILDFHDFRINGKTAFTGLFTDFEFLAVTAHSFDGDTPFLKLVTSGSIGLQDDNITALDFDVSETTPQFLRTLFGDTMDSFQVRKLHSDGKVRYLADAGFDHHNIQSAFSFHDLSVVIPSPAGKKIYPLNGSFHLNFDSTPGILRFDHTRLTLKDKKDRMIFDLGLHGSLHLPEKTQTICRLESNGIDFEFLMRAWQPASSSPQPQGPESADSDSQDQDTEGQLVWPFQTEPPVLQLGGYQAGFDVDLQNLSFTEFVHMSLSGHFQAQNDAFAAKQLAITVNEAPAVLNGNIILDPAGYRYDLHLAIRNLQAAALMRAAEAFQDKKENSSNMKLTIDSLEAKVSGAGLSIENIEKNFKCCFQASLSNISVPPAVQNYSLFMQIMLLPVTSLPRAIEYIPKEELRKPMMKLVMGDHVELLTGNKNFEFEKGEVMLESDHSDLLIRRLYLYGPVIKTKVIKGWLNPFYNEMEVETLTRFSGVTYPMRLKGSIDSSKLVVPDFLVAFWAKNAESLLTETADAVTLGYAINEDEFWREPAKEIKRKKRHQPPAAETAPSKPE